MPRKPTKFAREARASLEQMLASLPEGVPLPTLARLGETFALHPSSVLRILRDLVQEGAGWQSPSGKFFAPSSREHRLRGLPICFVGRELWHWSRLYQEILEGVSEVAAANGSPLAVLTARSLVRQISPEEMPRFATARKQGDELAALLAAAPKHSAGFILDHLWAPEVIRAVAWPGGARIQLLRRGGGATATVRVDLAKGARMVASHARMLGAGRVLLVDPFRGDPVIDESFLLLQNKLAPFDLQIQKFEDLRGMAFPRRTSVVVCPEDNVAGILAGQFGSKGPRLMGTQGTGVLHAPHARLRYDYKRLGRAAASFILNGEEPPCFGPLLVPCGGS